jgi:hypothetical protein
MVDQEALESVLSAPDNKDTGFVRLVQAGWEPEELDKDVLRERNGAKPEEEPLEGCTEHDVGWINVSYRGVEVSFVYMTDSITRICIILGPRRFRNCGRLIQQESRGDRKVCTFQVLVPSDIPTIVYN